MPAKTKQVQVKDLTGVSERDCFQTPRYATQLLIPYIPVDVTTVWECAAGDRRIANVLDEYGFSVHATDLKFGTNFLEQTSSHGCDAEITNPPFSLKEEFFRKCLEFDNPFALLIPFDMNGWLAEAFDKWGCQGLVPNRRINYITPNTLNRIHEGEIWKLYNNTFEYSTVKGNLIKFKKAFPNEWKRMLVENKDYAVYKNIDDAPQHLLHRYSSSDFHSFWLTRHFNLPQQLTFVHLSIDEIKNNI